MTLQRKKTMWFPVVMSGAEPLVRARLLRRNILTYQAPAYQQGYDLVCVHPDPRHVLTANQARFVRVQVKSRCPTNCGRQVAFARSGLECWDFLTVVFLNVGCVRRDGFDPDGARPEEIYTLPADFVHRRVRRCKALFKLELAPLQAMIEPYEGDAGLEQIARRLGVPRLIVRRPSRNDPMR